MASRRHAPFVGLLSVVAALTITSRASADARVDIVRPLTLTPRIRETLTRLRAELGAAGFEVGLVKGIPNAAPRAQVERMRDDFPSIAAIAISTGEREEAAEVCIADRLSTETMVQCASFAGVEPEERPRVLTVSAVELLRARMVKISHADNPPPSPPLGPLPLPLPSSPPATPPPATLVSCSGDAPPGRDQLDEVHLKNGGLVLGNIVSIEDGRCIAIIMLGTGERHTYAWSEVEQPISRPAPAPPRAPAAQLPLPPGVVWMHIETKDPHVELRVSTGTLTTWSRTEPSRDSQGHYTGGGISYSTSDSSTLVCTAPCDTVVDGRLGQSFFFSGSRVTESSSFQLVGRSGPVTVEVQPGSATQKAAGVGLLITGAAITTIGLVGMLGSFVDDATTPVKGAWIGVGLGGVVLMLVGGVLQLTTDTRYSFPAPAKPGAKGRVLAPRIQGSGLAWSF